MGIFSKVKSVFGNHSDASIIEDELITEDEPIRGWLTMDELAERYKAAPSAAGVLFSVGTVFACVNYYKAVKRVYNAGLMNGTSDKTFD